MASVHSADLVSFDALVVSSTPLSFFLYPIQTLAAGLHPSAKYEFSHKALLQIISNRGVFLVKKKLDTGYKAWTMTKNTRAQWSVPIQPTFVCSCDVQSRSAMKYGCSRCEPEKFWGNFFWSLASFRLLWLGDCGKTTISNWKQTALLHIEL